MRNKILTLAASAISPLKKAVTEKDNQIPNHHYHEK